MLSRRTFLKRGAASTVALTASAAGGSFILDACSANSGASSKQALPTIDYQLSWVKNVEFGGSYIADTKGYYQAEGVKANLIAGGPNTAPEPLVASNKALVAVSVPEFTATAREKGAKIKIIAAHFQKNPFAIMSLATSPIRNPQGMVGKKIGVQADNLPVWRAFLKANHINPSTVHRVPVQFDPQPLVSGEVDGWISLAYEEPSQLAHEGVKTHVFLFDDYGLPELSDVLIASEASLADKSARGKLIDFLRGEIRGWEGLVTNPALAARLATKVYGKNLGLNQDEQTREAQSMVDLVQTPETRSHGLLWMTQAKMDATIATLHKGGISATKSDLFDTSILEAAYGGKTRL